MSASPLNLFVSHGDTTPSWRMHIAVAQMAYDKGLFSAAARNYRTALSLAESLHLGDAEVSVGLVGLAKCHCEQGNFAEAESLYRRVLDIDQATMSSRCGTLAEDLYDLATLYLRTNRFGEAEGLLKKSVTIWNDLDVQSINLAAAEKSLGYIYCQAGKLDKAERTMQHALSICDTSAGRQTAVYAEALIVQGLIAVKRNRLTEAEDLIERAIASFELLTGGEHPELAKFLDLAAEIFGSENAQSKVKELTDRAKSIRSRINARDH